jgi:hypothetical protein
MTPQKVSALIERRVLDRKECFIPVDYVVKERAYRDFIENISREGAFIGTSRPVLPGTELVMTFSWVKTGQYIKSTGIVVRQNRDGFAVVFPQPLTI